MKKENSTKNGVIDNTIKKSNIKKKPKMSEQITELNEQINRLSKEVLYYKEYEKKLMEVSSANDSIKRREKDLQSREKFASVRVIRDILVPLERIKQVLKMTETASSEVKHWATGFTMVMNQFNQALVSHGVEEITAKTGDEFNHDIHEAVEKVESKDFQTNQITQIISNGYKMYDRVIQHVLVKVAK